MKPDCRDALVLALERGIAGSPEKAHWHFINACPLQGLDDAWKPAVVCHQDLRPEYLALGKQGYVLADTASTDMRDVSGAILLLGRSRKWNEHQIARMWNDMPIGTRLIVAGDKNGGIGSIRKWFAEHAEITDSLSKFHAVVFWADKQSEHKIELTELVQSSDGYLFGEGGFSANGPDAGSMLLAGHFDNRIRGKVADLGAGWGYLSGELLKKSSTVASIDLFEAHRPSLVLAEKNLADANLPVSFHWIDVTTEFKKTPYDWVIMNPPFHSGRSAEPALGKRFIDVAASTLPSGGRLLMVANKNLPYEKNLEERFRKFEKLEERDGFKVFEAVK